MTIGRGGRPIRRRNGAIGGGVAGYLLFCLMRGQNLDVTAILLGCAGFVFVGSALGMMLGPPLGRLIDLLAPDPTPKPGLDPPPSHAKVLQIPPLPGRFGLGRLMIAVAVAGVGLGVAVRVPEVGTVALAALAGLLLMAVGALAFACIGAAFGRLARPTVHPLSDHAVGYHGLDPAKPDPGIAFEPIDPS